jgi:hypothetical protein
VNSPSAGPPDDPAAPVDQSRPAADQPATDQPATDQPAPDRPTAESAVGSAAEPAVGSTAEPAVGSAAEPAVELSKAPAGQQPVSPAADQPIWAIGPAAVGPAPGDEAGPDAPGPAGFENPPPDWVPVFDEPQARTTPRDWVLEIVAALAVAVVLTGLGAGLAYVWEAISPRTVLEMSDGGAVYTEPNPEGYVAGESVYLLLTAGLGIVSPVVVWLLVRRRRGPILLAGLAVGSVAGATLMAWLGARIGLEEYRQLLAGAPVGTRFEIPVKVYSAVIDVAGFKIQGAVLVQAMIAVAVYTFLAGFYPTPSLRPERAVVHFVPPGQHPPAGPPAPWPGPVAPDPGLGLGAVAQGPDGAAAGPSPQPGEVSSGWPEKSDHRAAPAPPAAG